MQEVRTDGTERGGTGGRDGEATAYHGESRASLTASLRDEAAARRELADARRAEMVAILEAERLRPCERRPEPYFVSQMRDDIWRVCALLADALEEADAQHTLGAED